VRGLGDVLQERVLELEYVKAVAPRKQEEPCPHDDWVSAVDGSNPRYGLCLVACAQPDICGNNLSGLECLFFFAIRLNMCIVWMTRVLILNLIDVP